MAAKWFIHKSDDSVEGPLSADEILNRIKSGEFQGRILVWGQGMEHWRTIDWWTNEHSKIDNVLIMQAPKEVWHYALDGKSHGPYDREQLIEQLKHQGVSSEILLWTKGMKEWAPLVEFFDLLEEMGAGRRQYPRAPVEGLAILKGENLAIQVPIYTISEGGFGIKISDGIEAGMNLNIEITSNSFRQSIHARADVRYVVGGSAGLRFNQLSSEARGAIVQYVKQAHTRFKIKAA